MPRYEAPTGHWWEVDVAAETMFDERWGGAGVKAMSRVRHCASAAARDATIAELVAKHVERGFVLVGSPAMRAVAPPPPGRLVRGLERGTEWAQLALDGARVTHRRGDTAHPGEWTVDDDLAREDGAAAFALVEQLTADYVNVQGFVVVGERDPARKKTGGAIAPVNAELEAECIAAPDTAAPWAVYADYLMTAGDPRGDIAALAAADRIADAMALARDHALLGNRSAVAAAVDLRWRFGFVRGATIVRPRQFDSEVLADLTRDVLALPIARFVDELQFGLSIGALGGGVNDWRPTLDAVLASAQAPHVRALRFDAFTRRDAELSWVAFGDFTGAWAQLPALEVLAIRSGEGGELGDLVLPRLKEFVRESGGLGGGELAAIAAARWPALEKLEIWLGDPAYGARGAVRDLDRVLRGEEMPALHHLGLVACAFSDELVPALADGRVIGQLRTLDLSKGVMAADAVRAMIDAADAFAHLARIDVGDNLIAADDFAVLRRVLPNVRGGEAQRELDDDDGDRFPAVGE